MVKNPGTKYEEWIASTLGQYFPDARRTKASGATWGSGDVQAGPLEIEAKDRPTQKSVTISKETLKRTEEAAKNRGATPIIANRCQVGNYVTLRWIDFENMLDRLITLETQADRLIEEIDELNNELSNCD